MEHPFIELIVKKPLEIKDAKLWKETVESVAPTGTPTATEIRQSTEIKNSNFYKMVRKKAVAYIVPLTRDLNEDEVEDIVRAWNAAWDDKKTNFVINFSTKGRQKVEIKKIKESKLNEIAKTAAKLSHTKWYQNQVDAGWGYGPRLDPIHHKNPLLLPWDQLADKYQQQRIQLFLDLLEVLDSMKLAIVQQD